MTEFVKWSGQFTSQQYPAGFACGLAEVDLKVGPEGPVQDIEYQTPFCVVYTGLFRAGQKILGLTKVCGGTMKGTLSANQALTFTVKERGPNFIRRDYISSNPSDSGTFQLVPGPLVTPTNGGQCVLF